MNNTNEHSPRFEIPFFPVLICAYLPLKLLSPNLAVFDADQVVRAVVILSLVGLFLVTGLTAITKNRHLAGLICALLIGTIWVKLVDPSAGLPFFIITAALFIYLWRKTLAFRVTRILNVFSIAIFIQPFGAITYDYLVVQNIHSAGLEYSPFANVTFETNKSPNIVHILLDGYPNSQVLKNEFGFNNSGFINNLKSRGFLIGNDVRTPYNQTTLAMSAVFSGNYLDTDRIPMNDNNGDRMRMALGQVMSKGSFKARLAEQDYAFIFSETGYLMFQPGNNDKHIKPDFGLFSLNPFEEVLIFQLLAVLPYGENPANRLREGRATKFNAYLKNALESDAQLRQGTPFHYFAHILAPHPPFVIDRNGNTTDEWLKVFSTIADASDAHRMQPEWQAEYRLGFLEKLRFINSAILPNIDKLIAEVPSPKVIIIHGDHGSGASFHHNDRQVSCLKDRYSPFLAIYTDDPDIENAFSKIETERFNLVNTLRILSDSAFGTSLGELDDKSWYAPWDEPRNMHLLTNADIDAECTH